MRTLLFAFAFAISAFAAAPTIRITSGLTRYQVHQRNSSMGNAAIAVTGTSTAPDGADVEYRVDREMYGPGPWRVIGKVISGKWQGTLTLGAGGPYTAIFRVAGSTEVAVADHVLVGDLWVLAGQSNMEGVGDLTDVEQPSPQVHSFNQSDEWVLATEPLHSLRDAIDPVHWAKNKQGQPERLTGEEQRIYQLSRRKGAGLGLAFAKQMAMSQGGMPIGLIPCAHGGTSMTQWSPSERSKGGNSLYGAMLRRIEAVGGKVAGVVWYQGEAEANSTDAPLFQKRFEDFVAILRRDLNAPALPFLYVQIGRHVSSAPDAPWNMVQQAQLNAESRIPYSLMVSSINSSLDDGIHVDTQDLRRIGKQLAQLSCLANQNPCGTVRGPRPLYSRLEGQVVHVYFDGAGGGLRSDGRLSGFTVHDASGAALPAVFQQEVDPQDKSSVILKIQGKLPAGATVHYGAGRNPYCNLTDSAGYAAPVFGPLPIQQ